MFNVKSNQRFSKNNPCPVCGGHSKMPHGNSIRCFGFISEDGNYCNCTREEYAGGIVRNTTSETFTHFMHGMCKCGTQHGPPIPPNILDLRAAKLQNEKEQEYKRTTGGYREPELEYSYVDEHGEILFQTLRYSNPKDFSQRRPDDRGGWIYNLQGVRRVLYDLPNLIKAPKDSLIFIVEGEKDVATLKEFGFIATCNPMGAKKWREDYNPFFKDRHVVIVPDNDKDGQAHAEIVKNQLMGYVASMRIVYLPDLPERGDVSDWIKAGRNKEDLISQVENSEEINIPKPDLFPLLTWEDLANLPQPEWLIGHEIIKGYLTGIYGKSHLGKSFKALDYALTAAQSHSVVYIIAESANGYYARVKAWCNHHQKSPGNIRFITIPVQILDLMQVTKLKKTLEAVLPEMVVIDTLSKTFMGGNENDTNDMRTYIGSCNEIRMAFNATVIVVHHEPKAGGSPRGSYVFFADMDTIIRMEKTEQDKVVKIICEKQKDAPQFDPYQAKIQTVGSAEQAFDFSTSCVIVTMDVSNDSNDVITSKLSDADMEVLILLSKVKETGKGTTNMMDELGIQHRSNESARISFYQRIRKLRELGLVIQHKERGPYSITDKGFDQLPLIEDEEIEPLF